MDKEQKKKRKKIFALIAAVLLAGIVGLGIYNSKGNRTRRQLDLGYRCLENGQYEEAAAAFGKAAEIDGQCIEAYAGGIRSFQNLENTEEKQAFYDRALDAVRALDAASLAENLDCAADVYLAAQDVCGTASKQTAEILEEGLHKTENPKIKEALFGVYCVLAENCVREKNYDQGLVIYDRLLELEGDEEKALAVLSSCLKAYFETLKENQNYKKIRELAEKYKDVLPDAEFSVILEEVDALEQREAGNRAFMEKVYNLMAAKDYEGMNGVDGSEEAKAFVEAMTEDRYLYFPDENESKSGTGAGVYKFGRGGYIFYYGAYSDGSREGSGISFCNDTAESYTVFTGEWKNDAPNGPGEIRSSGTYVDESYQYSIVTTGNFVNGLCDGEINSQMTDPRGTFQTSYTAVQGIPSEDKTEEYVRTCTDADWGAISDVPEGNYIYAYSYDPDSGDSVYSYVPKGETLGVIGFAGLE